MKNYIEEKKQETIKVYKTQPERIISDYRREKEYMQGYHGRELLELIQNADDELTEDQSKEICISFHNDTLTISNCGTPFSKEGVDSLMISNISDKKSRKKKVIGNKGTGFRAILGWAEKVIIHSGELHIAFSEEYSQKYLKSKMDIELGDDGAAILAFPEWIQEQNVEAFTTEIAIKVKDDESVIEDIVEQMEAIDGTLLLFLNMAESISIETDDNSVRFGKRIEDGKVVIEKYEMGNLEEEITWFLNRKEEQEGDKTYTVVIAYRMDRKVPDKQVIYSYFPTEVDFPYPVLLHANLNLDANRNHLIKGDETNRRILNTAAVLLVDTALKIAENKETASYEALSIVVPTKEMHNDLRSYSFREILLSKLKTSKILPTVENKYISFGDGPVFYRSKLATILKGPNFSELLKYIENRELASFVANKTGDRYYKAEYLSKCINAWAEDREMTSENIKENVILIKALIEEYGGKNEKPKVNLLFCSDGYQAKWSTPVFIKESKLDVTDPPEFTNIKYMAPEMRKELEQYWRRDIRSIVWNLSFFNVKEYSIDKIIEKMTASIKEKMDTCDIDTAKMFSDQCLSWLWQNRKYIKSINQSVKIFLYTREGNLKVSDQLYIGKEYGNNVCEDLLKDICTNIFVEDIREKLDGDYEEQEIYEFLKVLRLAEYPRKISLNISPIDKQDYKKKIWGAIEYPIKLGEETFINAMQFSGAKVLIGTVTDVEYLSNILEKSSTKAIVSWINRDKELSNILFTEYDAKARVKVLWGSKQNYRDFPPHKLYPYLCWKFTTGKWIEVGDERYDIRRCILKSIGEKFAPTLVQPDIDRYIKDLEGDKKQLKNDYEKVFRCLGICQEYSDLPLSLLYSVLYILPEKDKEGKIAPQIYKNLAKTQIKTTAIPEKEKFLKLGRVWGNHGYQKVSETFYLDKIGICKRVCDAYNLIELPHRLDLDKIQEWLGISKLALNGKIIGEPQRHQLNTVFEKDFQEYKVAAFCYRIVNKSSGSEIQRFKELKVVLCSQVMAEYNDKEVILEDYDYISEDGKVYYLQVPESLYDEAELYCVDMGMVISSILCDVLNSTSLYVKFRNLYSYTQTERKKLIYDDIDDETIIERSTRALGMNKSNKEEFITLVKRLAKTECNQYVCVFEKIDYDHINSVSNAPLIINCFKMAGIDIAEYNAETTSQKLSLLSYYYDKIEVLRTKYRELYKRTLYEKIKMESIEEKKKLVDKFLKYEKDEIPVVDSVLFDCEQAFVKATGISIHCNDIDLGALLEENRKKLEGYLPTTEFMDEFLTITENASLLYYGEFEMLKISYEEYISKQKEPSIINIDKSINNLCSNVEIFNVRTVPNSLKSNTISKKMIKLGYSKLSQEQQSERENIGFMGEKYVFDMLKEKYKNVAWVSENARKAKVNPEGSADLGYDMEYLDENGKKIYVEVKASSLEAIEFHMSSSEFNFAKRHSKEYDVIFVANVASNNPKIYILSDLVTEEGFNECSYSVQVKSEYTITANIEEQNKL